MEGDPTRLSELGFTNLECPCGEVHVPAIQRTDFADPHPGDRQESKQSRVGRGSQALR